MRFFRWRVPAVAATCASSPSSPAARPCATSSATAVSRPHHRASRPPARGPPLSEASDAEHDPTADPLPQSTPAFEFDQRLNW